jgi:hypothetical protein
MKVFTREQVAKKIRAWTGNFDTHTAAAESVGVHKSAISSALNGDRPISPALLGAVGLERVTVYACDVKEEHKQ